MKNVDNVFLNNKSMKIRLTKKNGKTYNNTVHLYTIIFKVEETHGKRR